MIEINKTAVKLHGELPVIMSEMQVGLIGLYDALKKYYSEDALKKYYSEEEGNSDLQAFLAYMAVVEKATQLIFQKDKASDGEIRDAIEYKDALDAALDNIKKS